MSEFLPQPRWRERWSPTQLRLAIAATFASIVLVGAAMLWVLLRVLGWLDAPGWVGGLAWASLTAGSTVWAVTSRTPATASDMEYQSWTEYVVRHVMVGSGTTRRLPIRVITGVVFGAPVGCYFVVFLALAVTGLA